MENKILAEEPQLEIFKEKHSSTLDAKGGLIVSDEFPFEELSVIAVPESYRKEVYRPIYHIHKWWAQRLGSVFRGIIIGAHINKAEEFIGRFYSYNEFSDTTVFDPFMGSGTTIGEAHKLSCTALGRDINPIAFQNVKISLSRIDREKILEAFDSLESSVGEQVKKYYKSFDSDGKECDVLYFFWVKYLPCPNCEESIDLFSNYIFAKHAYVKKYPRVQIVCPRCFDINEASFTDQKIVCHQCSLDFNPQEGTVKGPSATCKSCDTSFSISKAARKNNQPPKSKMYAKLVLRADGKKEYLPATDYDKELYATVSGRLSEFENCIPNVPIEPGYNTNQVLNYGYRSWRQFFNERQLVCLLTLLNGIKTIDDNHSRNILSLLFSAILEFNNNFNSYKGEGTGAVRHLFSHHVLKPERTPIEANLWGTPKSSGSFSTLFKSRVLRAIAYQTDPFELVVSKKNYKKYGINRPFDKDVSTLWPPTESNKGGDIHISCGSSDSTNLEKESVDLIVTDPPFFDNVHYSELADFFYSWTNQIYGYQLNDSYTTRSKSEVQDTDANAFSFKLTSVFAECHRVLKKNGLLIFTYHHSRKEGWSSVAKSVLDAGFTFIQSHPVKAEMSVAAPKLQAKSPIDYDIILICKRIEDDDRPFCSSDQALEKTKVHVQSKLKRLDSVGLKFSFNDIRIITNGELLKFLSPKRSASELVDDFENCGLQLAEFISFCHEKI